jgi:hypothetical protein
LENLQNTIFKVTQIFSIQVHRINRLWYNYNYMQSTPFTLPTSIIANAPGVNSWINPTNIYLVDNQFTVSQGAGSILEVGNFNLNIPQGNNITNFVVQIKGYVGSFATTLQIYAVDDTTGVALAYPLAPFSGFSGTNTLYTLPASLFGTTWSVDQANNIKLQLIADGELWLDAVLISAEYVPVIAPVPVSPSSGQIVVDEFVEAQPFRLAQSMTSTDLHMFLQSFNYPDGTNIQYVDFYGEADMVIDQGIPGYEEQVTITNVEQNYQSSGLCRISFGTLANRGLKFHYPYTSDSSLIKNHFGTAECVISNSAKFYSRFLRRNQIGALVSAPITVYNQNSPLSPYGTGLNFTGAGVTVTNDGIDAAKKNINIPGFGVSQPVPVFTSTATSGTTPVTSLTWMHTVSGTDRLLTVENSWHSGATISGITFNGIALTSGVTDTFGSVSNDQWFLVAPPVGTYNIVVTLSSAECITSGAQTWNSVNQSTPIGITQTAHGSSLNPSLVLTTSSNNSIVIDSLATNTLPIVYTVGSGQVVSWNQTNNPLVMQAASSYQQAGTSPDAVTMHWSITQSIPWVQVAMEIIGVSGSTGVQSVTGLNTNNADPANPIVRISVDGSTITGLGTPGSPLVAHAGGATGITSINGDTTAAQTIVEGAGISVSSAAGTTTITNTSPGGGSSNPPFGIANFYYNFNGGNTQFKRIEGTAYYATSGFLYVIEHETTGGFPVGTLKIRKMSKNAVSGVWEQVAIVTAFTSSPSSDSTGSAIYVSGTNVYFVYTYGGVNTLIKYDLSLTVVSTTTLAALGSTNLGSGIWTDGTFLWVFVGNGILRKRDIVGGTDVDSACVGFFPVGSVQSFIVSGANVYTIYGQGGTKTIQTLTIGGGNVTLSANYNTVAFDDNVNTANNIGIASIYAAGGTLSALVSYPLGWKDTNAAVVQESGTQFAYFASFAIA